MLDASSHKHKLAEDEPDAKTIHPEPHSVKKANSYQFMPIIRSDGKKPVILKSHPFDSEDQLQSVVADNPTLLCFDGDAPLALVTREFSLPGAGSLDVLMVNSEGLPVPIECKLARNPQSRREVVGQIVDYVSILTALTVDELDHAVDGKLEEALRTFDSKDADPATFDRRWQQVGTSLRAGQARYVIVVDEVPQELERIIRFLIQRSELDIRLVQISRYPDPSGHDLYVPANIVDIAPSERLHGANVPKTPAAEFQAVLDEYNARASEELQAVGRASHYRQVRPPGWPGGVHYEFMKGRDSLSVEFHIESTLYRWLGEVIRKIASDNTLGYNLKLEWDPKWSTSKGRIRTVFPLSTPAPDVAVAMCRLIQATRERISAALAKPPSP